MANSNADNQKAHRKRIKDKGWCTVRIDVPERYKPRLKRIEAILQGKSNDKDNTK